MCKNQIIILTGLLATLAKVISYSLCTPKD